MECRHHYPESKGGLIAFPRTLAKQVSPCGRPNAIAPGQIATEMGARNVDQVRIVEQVTPLGHVGMQEEVAGGVLFLLSPSSSYVAGRVLNIITSSTLLTVGCCSTVLSRSSKWHLTPWMNETLYPNPFVACFTISVVTYAT